MTEYFIERKLRESQLEWQRGESFSADRHIALESFSAAVFAADERTVIALRLIAVATGDVVLKSSSPLRNRTLIDPARESSP